MLRLLAIIIFILALATGGVAPLFEANKSGDERGRFERRALARFPKLTSPNDLLAFPAGFDSWAKDHFGFRSQLIDLHAVIHSRILRDLPSTRYIRGKNGWFFRGIGKQRGAKGGEGHYNDILDLAGREPLSKIDLDNWSTRIAKRRQIVEERGGVYLFTIGPRKSTIYSEYLPEVIVNNLGKTRLDQLNEALLSKHSDVFFNLVPALRLAKTRNDYSKLFYQTDTHWNYYGAFFAYEEFMKRLSIRLNRDGLTPVALSNFNIVERPGWFHTGFLAETRIKEEEGFVALYPKSDSPYRGVKVIISDHGFIEAGGDEVSQGKEVSLSEVGIGNAAMRIHKVQILGKRENRSCRYMHNDSPGLPIKDLILLGDSFLEMSFAYFAAHASHIYLCRQINAMELPVFDVTRNAKIDTQVVLQELTESYLVRGK